MAKKETDVKGKDLLSIKPIGDNQKTVFETWDKGNNQFVYGAAGTGKTFILLYKALQDVLNPETEYDRVIIVRSLIPTREIGFLPNEQAFSMLFERLKNQGTLHFMSTSFLRGLTFDNSIIIVDECQNLNFHELDTIVTRVGQNSKISFAGDFFQTDLTKSNERNGLHDFVRILDNMSSFNVTEFNIGDIVRSGFVREYLIEKTKLGFGVEL